MNMLMQVRVDDDAARVAWVARVLQAGVPEGMRLLVSDFDGTPQLVALAQASHPHVLVQAPPLDALPSI